MAKIIKLGSQNITPSKVANPFRTSRNSTTNPFKYSNFEGNTLQFADVFEGFEAKKETNKLKLIASSVAGSMNKMKSSITEPIVNFVNRLRTGVSNAWDYAKNTNVSDLPAVKAISDVLNTPVEIPGMKAISDVLNKPIEIHALKGLSESLVGMRENMHSHISGLGNDISGIGKELSSKWNSLISNIHSGKKISSDMPVCELEQMWKDEIAISSKEVA